METIKLSPGKWLNLYAETGITVGVQIDVINITPNDVKLAATVAEPTTNETYVPLVYGSGKATNLQGNVGAWVMCISGGAINVSRHVDDPSWRLSSLDTFPEGVFEGLRALTTQTYVEANSKLGVQYEVGFYNPTLTPSSTVYFVMQTGPNPVALKGRRIEFDGLGVQSMVFENPEFTGGTPVTVFNLNHKNPVASGVTLLASPNVTDEGIQVQATKTFLGANLNGRQVQIQTGQEAQGLEYIYDANTSYLFRLDSLDSSDNQRLATFVTWYEGGLDLPRLT